MKSKNTLQYCRRIQMFLLVLLFTCLCFVQDTFVSAAEDEEREVIRVGFFAFDGYHMMDETGARSGYGYDFLCMASRYLDVDFEYVGYENSWDDMDMMLENGQIDLVTSAQTTRERMGKFDFSKPIGTSSCILTVKSDNKEIIAYDYDTYDGMLVGMLKGNSRNEDFAEYAAEKGFSYTAAYFSMPAELEEALQSGAIDAIVTSSLRKTEKERILDTFAAREFYVMVRKGDTALLEKINYAIDQMNAVEGDWMNALNNDYYTRADDKYLAFTDSEKELLRQYRSGEKILTVSASHDRAPYSYVEDGELKGIIPDYFAKLAEYMGIPYQVMIPSSREEYNQWQKDASVDVFMDTRDSFAQWCEENSFSITAPYTTMRLAQVTRVDFSGKINTLAVASGQGIVGIEDTLIKDAERLVVSTREEAMRAVQYGKADAAITYLYTAQKFVNHNGHGLLTYTLLEEPTYDYCIACSPNVPHELSGIFTKSIYAMPNGTFEEIAAQYTNYKAENVDLLTWITLYPLPAVLLSMGFLVLCILTILLWQRQKVVRIEQERSGQLKELADKADRANRAKSDFLANVSHDIRTPMNAIVGIVNLMGHEPDISDKMQDYIQKVQKSSQHLLGLIDDVLNMSKIEANEISLQAEPFRLSEQIGQVDNIVRAQSIERGQIFQVCVQKISHDYLIADGVRLRQILLNLLSNAVKYTEKEGTITFEVEELPADKPECARFQFIIADTGSGMTPEFLEHVYEPFVRSEASVTNKIQGTGLGMAITKKLVDFMSGDIMIDSIPGKGTRITVLLEFPIDTDRRCQTEVSEEKQSILRGMRFLCAEDNALNAEILEALLEMHHASCTIYPDGAKLVEAFKTVKPGEYDAILMDIQMPDMNGLEAAEWIRKGKNPVGKTIPIIAMTANAFVEDIQHSLDAGMNAHLSKPIDMELLEKTIRNLHL